MKFEFAVCIKDEADLASGHKRKKRGDVIACRPAPWNWGKEEVKNHLIVTLDGLTQEEADEMCRPMYENDIKGDVDNPKKPIAKRKYSIDIDKIKQNVLDIDLVKLEDYSLNYQPLKDSNIEIDVTSNAVNFDLIKNKYTNEYKKAKKV